MAYWALVVSQPNKERLAVQNIRNQGYEYYLPMIREKVIRQGKQIELARPLFRNYIFTRIQAQWSSLTGTYGVSGIVLEGRSPQRVPERVIETLKNRQDKDGFIRLDEKEELEKGQTVKINSGPFEGHIGIYEGMSADERAIVLFKLLGSDRELRLDPKMLVTI